MYIVIPLGLITTSIADVSELVIMVIAIEAYPVASSNRILFFLVIILVVMVVRTRGLIFLNVLFITLLQFVQEEILFNP